MKKQTLIILVAFLAGTQTFAQKVTWGPETKQSKKEYLNSIAYCDKNCMYILDNERVGGMFSAKVTPSLHKFNKSFSEEFNKEYETTEKNTGLLDFIYAKEKFHLFTVKYDKDAEKTSLYASTIDMKGTMKTTEKQIASMSSEKRRNQASYDILVSSDTTKFAAVSLAPYEKDGNEKYYIRVMDNNLNKVFESTVTLPYGDKFLTIEDYTLGNNGDVYIIGKLYESVYQGIFGGVSGKESKKEEGKKKPNYQYLIFRYSADNPKGKEYKLSLGEKFISDVSFKVSPDGNLVCSGLYCTKLYGAIQGVFYMRVDGKTGDVVKKSMKDIDGSFVENLRKGMRQKDKGGDQGLSREFDIKNFVLKEDGGACVVLEYLYIYTVTYTDSRGYTHTTTHYVYGDKLVVSVDNGGNIEWVADIPTLSDQTSTIYGSSSLMIEGSNIHILYNDDEDNVDKPVTERPDVLRNPKKSVAVLATVNSSGKVSRKRLFENRDIETILQPRMCKQVSSNEMVLYGGKYKLIGAKEVRFGRLSW